jgi:hypothetical protein
LAITTNVLSGSDGALYINHSPGAGNSATSIWIQRGISDGNILVINSSLVDGSDFSILGNSTKANNRYLIQAIAYAQETNSGVAVALLKHNHASSTRPVLMLENAGSGSDVEGTSASWQVTKSGRGQFKQVNTPIDPVASGVAALDWDDGQLKSVTLYANTTFTFSNPRDGAKYTLILHQDDVGSRIVTWPSGATIKWRGGSEPTLTTAASGIDIVSMIYSNADSAYYADASLNFS